MGEQENGDINLTIAKIRKLLDFSHLEELFYFLSIVDEKQVAKFLEVYRKPGGPETTDKRVDVLVKKSKTPHALMVEIKGAMVEKMIDDYKDLRQEISSLRKKGIDVYVEDMKSLSIPLKIKIFRATENKDDYYKVKKIFAAVEEGVKVKKGELETKKLRERAIEEEKKMKKIV